MNRIKKVQIETIRDCNGKCRICDYRYNRPQALYMSGRVFRGIIKVISELPMLETVCLYNHNEPLLDPKIFKRIRFVKKKLRQARIELSTNGMLFREDDSSVFNTYCRVVDDRWVSFHGIDRDSYEKVMGLPWENGEKIRRLIISRPETRFVISVGLVGYTKEQVEDFWAGYNVKVMTFIPRDRAGNIKSDMVLSFNSPRNPAFDCWRFNKFLVFNTKGHLIPCSNDLKNMHRYANYKMSLGEIEDEREDWRIMNRIGALTVCRRCEDAWT